MSNKEKLQEEKESIRDDIDSRILWICVPIIIGGGISFFANFGQEIQIIIWAIMFAIAGFGIWAHSAKRLRKKREILDAKRWNNLDKRFDHIDHRFDELEKADKTLLRKELIKAHREWYEEKHYITLEALEFVDEVHDEYSNRGGNGSGEKMWQDLHSLPIREFRSEPNSANNSHLRTDNEAQLSYNSSRNYEELL